MNNRIKFTLTFIILWLAGCSVWAQDVTPVMADAQTKKVVIDSITSHYTRWDEISMSGKLSSPLLPMSPSVKIYMQRSKLVVISVSAPLIGEAVRIEIDKDEALLVNKMSNSYATVSTSLIESVCPGGLEALQNLMLGRITILGSGELSPKNADKVDIYEVGGVEWLVLPQQDLENDSFIYLYFNDLSNFLLDRFVVLAQDGSGNVDASFQWGKKDMTMKWVAEMGSRTLEATLKLNNPDSSPKKISRIELGSKYRKVDLKGVLRM